MESTQFFFHVIAKINGYKNWRILEDRMKLVVKSDNFDKLTKEDREELFKLIGEKRDELRHQEEIEIREFIKTPFCKTVFNGNDNEIWKKYEAVVNYSIYENEIERREYNSTHEDKYALLTFLEDVTTEQMKDHNAKVLKYFRMRGINLAFDEELDKQIELSHKLLDKITDKLNG